MTSQGNDKSTPFNQRIKEMHKLTGDINSLFEEINSFKSSLSWERKGLQDEQRLSDIIDRIIELGDLETLKTFQICFGRTGMLSKFYIDDSETKSEYKFSEHLKTKLDHMQQTFDNKLAVDNSRQAATISFIQSKLSKNKTVAVVEVFKPGSSVTPEMQENINRLQDPIEIYVTHLNESVQHLAQLDIVLTQLLNADPHIVTSNPIKKFRNEVREMHTNLVHLLTDKKSPLMMEVGEPIQRLQAFLDTTKFQAMQYGLADLKFRFTNEVKMHLNKNSAEYATALGISKDAKSSVYDYVRDATGFNKLESNKTCVDTLESAKVNQSTLNKVKNILNYMDGMVSVWACIEKNKDTSIILDRSAKKNVQGIVNGILLGLDSDLGLNKKLIERFTDEKGTFDKKSYDAYLGGCIEECMVKNSPDIFKRDTKTESLGRFFVNKQPTKSSPIRQALGLSPQIDEKVFEFVNPEKLKVNDLSEFYKRSKDKFHKNFTLGQMPIYLILAAIHPLGIQNRKEITHEEAKKIENKIGIYQSILNTLELGWTGRPRFGRARVMLDNTQSLGVKEEARGVFDRLLRFYQMHQPEIKQLDSHVIKQLQDTNRTIFGDFQTMILTRGFKSMGHGFARYLLNKLNANPNAFDVSDQNRRQMQYKFLKGKTIDLVDEKDPNLNDRWFHGTFLRSPKYEKFKDGVANPADAFVRSKIDPVENVHKKTKLENIYDELKIQDVIEDIRFIKSLESSTMLTNAGDEKEAIKNKYMEECESRYAGEFRNSGDEKFAGYMQFMSDRFDEAYAQIDTIPKYMSKYDSVTQLLDALDMQKDSQSEKYEEEKKKIEYEGLRGGKSVTKTADLKEEERIKQAILSQVVYENKTSPELKALLNEIYNSLTTSKSNFSDVQQQVSDIRKILEDRGDWSEADTKKMNRASTRVPRELVNSISLELSLDSLELQDENHSNLHDSQLISGGAANSNVVTEDLSSSSSRLHSTSFFSQEAELPQTCQEFVDKYIEPLLQQRDLIFNLDVSEQTDEKFEPIESAVREKLQEWNNKHSDQILDVDENFNLIKPNSKVLKK